MQKVLTQNLSEKGLSGKTGADKADIYIFLLKTRILCDNFTPKRSVRVEKIGTAVDILVLQIDGQQLQPKEIGHLQSEATHRPLCLTFNPSGRGRCHSFPRLAGPHFTHPER